MEKTALTQYLDWLAELKKCDPSLSSVLSLMEAKATELRDTVEKEQIEGTYLTGYAERCREIMGEETFAKSSTDYYNKKYKQCSYFEATPNTTSATICQHCGKEKYLH